MLKIILIRPGATDYDTEQRIQGSLSVPLNEEGSHEVARLTPELQGLGIEVVYAPATEPARQTGQALARALGVKFRQIERMQNLDHGLWQGMRVDEVKQKQPKVYKQWQEQPENVCPPEGEMLSDADERIRAALGKIIRRYKDKNATLGLVVPEPLASLVRRYVSRNELGDLWKATKNHGGWEVLEFESQRPVAQEVGGRR
jgi:broad specificity phosphatase PhoE